MDAPFRRRHVIALCICAFSCVLLLVNPALSRRLIDEVIIAQNPDPLLGILAVMLIVKLGREGLRYLMVIFLEKDAFQLFLERAENCAYLNGINIGKIGYISAPNRRR